MLTRPTEAVRRSGYWLVLALIALSYVLCAAQERPNPNPIAFLAQLATVAVALWIAEVSPVALRVSLAIVGVAVIAVLGAEIAGLEGHAVDIALSAASALACFIAPTAIIAHQVRFGGRASRTSSPPLLPMCLSACCSRSSTTSPRS